MKDFFKNIQTLLIVVLVAFLLFQRGCSSNHDKVEPKVITNIETKWDTITVEKKIYVPKQSLKVNFSPENIITQKTGSPFAQTKPIVVQLQSLVDEIICSPSFFLDANLLSPP